MKMTYSAVAVVGMSMVFSAAAAGVNQDRIPELQRDGREDGTSVTLAGCVARGTVTGTYILTNSAREGEATAKDAIPRTTVVLSGTDVDMSKHIGHSVSVTGSYAREWPPAFATTGKSATAGVVDDHGKKASRMFTVKALQMVADSCTQPAD